MKKQHVFFRNKIYRRIWMARTGSSLGDWFNQVALSTTVLAITDSPAAMGFVLLCLDLPQAVISPLVGPLIDRFSKRKIMIASDLVRAVVILSFILASVFRQMWVFYLGGPILGCASALFSPAKSATIPAVVEKSDLAEANALDLSTSGALAIIGALLGGIVSSFFLPAVSFLINCLSYVWSAVIILNTHWNEEAEAAAVPKQGRSIGNYKKQLLDGFKLIFKHRIILALFVTTFAFALSTGPYFIMVPVLGDSLYKYSGMGIGLLYAADGLAFILTGVLIQKAVGKEIEKVRRWYGFGFLINGLFFVAFAFSSTLWSGMLFLFLSQLGSGIIMSLSATLFQIFIPEDYRGRIFAIEGTVYTSTRQLSLAVSGPAIQLFGSPMVGTLIGVLTSLSGFGWMWISRRLDRVVPGENQSGTSEIL